MYAYRKTAVKAPCLASIKSNLPALRAAEHSFVVCPNSRPMTLWRSKGPVPNSVHFIHTEACGLYYGSLEFQHRDASLSLLVSLSLPLLLCLHFSWFSTVSTRQITLLDVGEKSDILCTKQSMHYSFYKLLGQLLSLWADSLSVNLLSGSLT